MTNLNITASQSTPSVVARWAEGTLEMRGDSYPENSFEFFEPLIVWIQTYLAQATSPLHVELHLLYLNTSSVKAMMDIFDMLQEAHAAGKQVCVKWFYDSENERIAELAGEFKEDCSFPFEIVPAPI